jgi:ankyrin repeat protein
MYGTILVKFLFVRGNENEIRLMIQHVNQIAKFLLDAVANIDVRYCYENGYKTIHYACSTGNIALVQLLLKKIILLEIKPFPSNRSYNRSIMIKRMNK